MKSQSCLCMQMSKAEPDFSDSVCVYVCEERVCVLACVSETTIGGLSAALHMAEDNITGRCAWIKLCIGSLPSQPFFYLSMVPVQLNPPTPPPSLPPVPPPQGKVFFFLEIMAVTIASIVPTFFCEVGMGPGALCLSLHIMLSYLQIGFTSARGGFSQRRKMVEGEGGGVTGGQYITHGSLVHKTNQNVNKRGDFFS